MKSHKIIYTDGGCPTNGSINAVGSWAFVEIAEVEFGPVGDKEVKALKKDSGYLRPDHLLPNTSIRMELIAIIKGLESFKESETIEVYSDSAYCVNGIKQQWYRTWLATGKNSQGKVPANMDLWIRLVELLRHHNVMAFHVKGHSGNTFNDIVDVMATTEIRNYYEVEGDK